MTATWDWAKGLVRWKTYTDDAGVRYDLTHLDPLRTKITLPAKPGYEAVEVELRVGFMSHAFTRECEPDETPDPYYSGYKDPRVFCPVRYSLSLRLPEFIRLVDGKNCYESNHYNGHHFVIENVDGLPAGSEYWVFLEMQRMDKGIVRVRVRSAYVGQRGLAPHGRGRKSVRFRAWLNRVLGLNKQTP